MKLYALMTLLFLCGCEGNSMQGQEAANTENWYWHQEVGGTMTSGQLTTLESGPDSPTTAKIFEVTDGYFITVVPLMFGSLDYEPRPKPQMGRMWVSATLVSPGSDEMALGDYNFVNSESTEADTREDEMYVASAQVYIDADDDAHFESSEALRVVSGRVTLSGEAPDYIFFFRFVLEDESLIYGRYQGSYR